MDQDTTRTNGFYPDDDDHRHCHGWSLSSSFKPTGRIQPPATTVNQNSSNHGVVGGGSGVKSTMFLPIRSRSSMSSSSPAGAASKTEPYPTTTAGDHDDADVIVADQDRHGCRKSFIRSSSSSHHYRPHYDHDHSAGGYDHDDDDTEDTTTVTTTASSPMSSYSSSSSSSSSSIRRKMAATPMASCTTSSMRTTRHRAIPPVGTTTTASETKGTSWEGEGEDDVTEDKEKEKEKLVMTKPIRKATATYETADLSYGCHRDADASVPSVAVVADTSIAAVEENQQEQEHGGDYRQEQMLQQDKPHSASGCWGTLVPSQLGSMFVKADIVVSDATITTTAATTTGTITTTNDDSPSAGVVVGDNYDHDNVGYMKLARQMDAWCKREEAEEEEQRISCDLNQQKQQLQQQQQQNEEILNDMLQESKVLEERGSLDCALNQCEMCLDIPDLSHREASHVYHRIGHIYWKKGDYKSSSYHLQNAIDLYMFCRDVDDDNTTTSSSSFSKWCLNPLAELYLLTGKVYLSAGDHTLSRKYLNRVVRILKVYDENSKQQEQEQHPSSSSSSSSSYNNNNNDNIHFRESLVARTLHVMSMIDESMGRYEKGIKRCQTALTTQMEMLHKQQQQQCQGTSLHFSPDLVATMLTYGSLHERIGSYHIALTYFLDVYAMCHRHYHHQLMMGTTTTRKTASSSSSASGPASSSIVIIDMGVAMSNIGWIHYRRGDYVKAHAAYIDAYNMLLQQQQSLSGHQHSRNIATLYVQMGILYAEQDKHIAALPLYKDALRMQRKLLGDQHDDVAYTLCVLASTLIELNRPKKAVELAYHASCILIDIFGVQHIRVGKSYALLGNLFARIGNMTQARQYLHNAYEIYRRGSINNNADVS